MWILNIATDVENNAAFIAIYSTFYAVNIPIQTFTQKSDFFQTTFELKVWIQTFAETSDQSGRPASGQPIIDENYLQPIKICQASTYSQ